MYSPTTTVQPSQFHDQRTLKAWFGTKAVAELLPMDVILGSSQMFDMNSERGGAAYA
jgi:hypothetical protein